MPLALNSGRSRRGGRATSCSRRSDNLSLANCSAFAAARPRPRVNWRARQLRLPTSCGGRAAYAVHFGADAQACACARSRDGAQSCGGRAVSITPSLSRRTRRLSLSHRSRDVVPSSPRRTLSTPQRSTWTPQSREVRASGPICRGVARAAGCIGSPPAVDVTAASGQPLPRQADAMGDGCSLSFLSAHPRDIVFLAPLPGPLDGAAPNQCMESRTLLLISPSGEQCRL